MYRTSSISDINYIDYSSTANGFEKDENTSKSDTLANIIKNNTIVYPYEVTKSEISSFVEDK